MPVEPAIAIALFERFGGLTRGLLRRPDGFDGFLRERRAIATPLRQVSGLLGELLLLHPSLLKLTPSTFAGSLMRFVHLFLRPASLRFDFAAGIGDHAELSAGRVCKPPSLFEHPSRFIERARHASPAFQGIFGTRLFERSSHLFREISRRRSFARPRLAAAAHAGQLRDGVSNGFRVLCGFLEGFLLLLRGGSDRQRSLGLAQLPGMILNETLEVLRFAVGSLDIVRRLRLVVGGAARTAGLAAGRSTPSLRGERWIRLAQARSEITRSELAVRKVVIPRRPLNPREVRFHDFTDVVAKSTQPAEHGRPIRQNERRRCG